MRPLLVSCAVLAVACSSSTAPQAPPADMAPECVTSSDCATSAKGHTCASGACVPCVVDKDCGAGMKCDNGQACVACLASSDCMPGQKCVGKACVTGCDAMNPCPSGQVCDTVAGACVQCVAGTDCPSATPVCDAATHQCVVCVVDNDCGPGKVCAGQMCATGCSGAHPACPGAQVCDVARGACVDCLADTDCKSTATPRCNAATSSCVACLPQNDNCPTGQYCAGTSCASGCKANADCTAPEQCNTATHACVQCVDDSACGFGMLCMGNKCVPGCSPQHACAGGMACCAAQSGGTGCVNLLSDTMNCGSCSNACATGSGCCGGVCTSLGTVDDCGGCGVVCPEVVNGIRGCSGGTCGIGGCNGAWADCDGKASTGCETDTSSDASNCGKCGNACGTPQNGSAACQAGKCVITSCTGTFRDCDGNFTNGCETDVSKDASNCGACGNSCGGGVCNAGSCALASCAAILAARPGSASGLYTIDPDGSGAFPPTQVYCDMVTDGGGWTRFHWTTESWTAGTDVLGVDLSSCTPTTPDCFARIPSAVTPKDLLIKDTTHGFFAAWHFNGGTISNAVLGAMRDKQKYCANDQGAWQPYVTNDQNGTWCGTGCEGGCDSFYYGTCRYNSDIGMELDGDNAWGCAAVKEGGTGPSTPDPDWGYLDYSNQRGEFGEMYYR